MNAIKYSNSERDCLSNFDKMGSCYHIWTPENFEIIFRSESEFRIGMGIIAVAAKLFPDIKIVTFQLMTNHLHIMAAGDESRIRDLFALIKQLLMRMASDRKRTIDWSTFKPGMRILGNLTDARNVLVYDNRNGFLVRREYTPFTYPWGANSCFFNPDSRKRYEECARYSTSRERRDLLHSHIADNVQGLRHLDGCISPYSFCDIQLGERLFRDAAHYFYALSRNIEQNKLIAKEIGESISYTEEELFAAISMRCKNEFDTANPGQIPYEAKQQMAKIMRFEYNATTKQIQRILRLENSVILAMFGCSG